MNQTFHLEQMNQSEVVKAVVQRWKSVVIVVVNDDAEEYDACPAKEHHNVRSLFKQIYCVTYHIFDKNFDLYNF